MDVISCRLNLISRIAFSFSTHNLGRAPTPRIDLGKAIDGVGPGASLPNARGPVGDLVGNLRIEDHPFDGAETCPAFFDAVTAQVAEDGGREDRDTSADVCFAIHAPNLGRAPPRVKGESQTISPLSFIYTRAPGRTPNHAHQDTAPGRTIHARATRTRHAPA